MSFNRRRALLVVLFIVLFIFAIPSMLKFVVPHVCIEPPDNPLAGSIILKNRAQSTTDKLLIFIHGVDSSGETAWKNRETGKSWPELIHEDDDFKNFDIYVVNYPSPLLCPSLHIQDIASNLLANLKNNHMLGHQQIFIIAHSMGGIVAEQVVTNLENYPPVLSHFREIVFLGSPTQGASIASVASVFSSNPQYADMASDGTYLRDLKEKWEHLLQARKPGTPPYSYCAFEGYRTDGLLVVPENMSQYHCDDGEQLPVFRNHIDMVKPTGTESVVYQNTKRLILDKVDNSVRTPKASKSGRSELQDCWLDGEHCGFQFSTGRVVAQYAPDLSADIVLMNQTDQTKTATSNDAMLFASNDSPPYAGGGDAGANGGIMAVSATDLRDVRQAPESGYIPHWLAVKVGGVYCVRTRDGNHFAKIKVVSLTNKSIGFDWVYQPEPTREFDN